MAESDDETDGPRLETGHKTDSYIFAINNTRIPGPAPSPSTDAASPTTELLIDDVKSANGTLTEEQLKRYEDDPFWKRLRRTLFLACCFLWALLIAIALYIVFASPGCAPIHRKWWQTAVMYQLWTPSFQDANNDGYGDLRGATERLNNLRKIGVDAVFPRPFVDTESSGLGATNLMRINERLGSLEDATEFIVAAHKKGLRVIIDIPLVGTSTENDWFQRSSKASLPENAHYAGYYFWKRNAPDGSEYMTEYKNSSVFYFHAKERPQIPIANWNSPNVSRTVKEAIAFWVDKGVDGFHLSFVDYLARTDDGLFPDWDSIVTFLKAIRTYINDERSRYNEEKIFLFASPEHLTEEQKRRLVEEGQLDTVVNTELTNVALKNRVCYESENSVAGCTNEILSDLLIFYEDNDEIVPIWQFGDPFISRLATRMNGSRVHAELLTFVQLLLPGASLVYYGDEIALRDVPNVQNAQQGAMLWDASENAGFSRAHELHAAVHAAYGNSNFESEYYEADGSVLKLFKRVAHLRKTKDVLINGRTYISKAANHSFTLCRFLIKENTTEGQAIVAAVNFGRHQNTQSLSDLPPFQANRHARKEEPLEATVLAASSSASGYYPRKRIDITGGMIVVGPDEGVLITFVI